MQEQCPQGLCWTPPGAWEAEAGHWPGSLRAAGRRWPWGWAPRGRVGKSARGPRPRNLGPSGQPQPEDRECPCPPGAPLSPGGTGVPLPVPDSWPSLGQRSSPPRNRWRTRVWRQQRGSGRVSAELKEGIGLGWEDREGWSAARPVLSRGGSVCGAASGQGTVGAQAGLYQRGCQGPWFSGAPQKPPLPQRDAPAPAGAVVAEGSHQPYRPSGGLAQLDTTVGTKSPQGAAGREAGMQAGARASRLRMGLLATCRNWGRLRPSPPSWGA